MGAKASLQDDAANKTDVISVFSSRFRRKMETDEMNRDQSFRGNSCLKLTKLIRPRLLSVNRKLWSKKSLLSPYLRLHFSGKVMFCGPKASQNALTKELDFGSTMNCFAV